MSEGPDLLPLFLKLEGRRVLVVGGGNVAAAKLPGLLASGAKVTIVAPRVLPEIERPDVRLLKRRFAPGDLDGVWLVVAAAPPGVNARVARAAGRRRIFVNAADDPERASAFAGGVLRKGGVTLAVSTSGRAPALAGLLREALDAVLPEDVETWASRAVELRRIWKVGKVPIAARRPLLLEALNRLYSARTAGSWSGP